MIVNTETYLGGLISVKNRSAERTVVCFSGPVAGDRYHFYRSFDDADVNVVFVKESVAGWFQYGLPGADGYKGLKDFLSSLISSIGGKELYCFGASMGGYAALLYGSLLNAKRVLTFGPRTYVHPTYITNSKLVERNGINEDIQKIFPLIKDYVSSGGEIINVCGSDEWLDLFHVARLEKLASVRNLTVPNAGHNVGAWLKEQGELNHFMVDSLLTGDTSSLDPIQNYHLNIINLRNSIVGFVKKYNNKNLLLAYQVIKEILDSYPVWDVALQKASLVATDLGMYDEALLYSDKQKLLNPSLLKGFFTRGRLMVCLGNWPEAIECLLATLNARPTLGSPLTIRCVHRCLAFSYLNIGDEASYLEYRNLAYSGISSDVVDMSTLDLSAVIKM